MYSTELERQGSIRDEDGGRVGVVEPNSYSPMPGGGGPPFSRKSQ